MAVVIDKIQGEAFLHDHPIKSGSSTPASAKTGSMFLNTVTGVLAIYFENAWITLHTLVTTVSNLLLESGDAMLLESGDNLILEG